MFEGGTHAATATTAHYGQQSPVSGRSSSGMNFPPRWPQSNGRSHFSRQSLDSMHPQVLTPPPRPRSLPS